MPKSYGAEFRAILDKQGIRQAWIADRFNVSRQVVHNWTKEGVPLIYVMRVASLLGVRPDRLRPDLFRVD